MITLNKDNFKSEVLDSKVPVLVDFWGNGCPPCRTMLPRVEALSKEMTDVKFGKLAVDDGMEIFSDYKVTKIPTFMVFKDGIALGAKFGVLTEQEMKTWITEKIQ